MRLTFSTDYALRLLMLVGDAFSPITRLDPLAEVAHRGSRRCRSRPVAHGLRGGDAWQDRVAAGGRRMFVGNRFLRMNSHSFDHVDLRVSSFADARKFYDAF